MKKSLIVLGLIVFVGLVGFTSAADRRISVCDPSIQLLNQDPYPASPGDYVDVVFQINGIAGPECERVSVEVRENFPFSLDPGDPRIYEFAGSAFVRDFSSTALAPYKLLVNEDAVDGDNKVEVVLTHINDEGEVVTEVHEFDIDVDGVKVDFEVSIRNYELSTNTMTFEILNVGEDDVVALAVDIPKQDSVAVKGASRNIIGDLDASDDTTFRFEAQPSEGDIEMRITYTDPLNERRQMIKNVYYDPSYFTGRAADQVEPVSTYAYLFWGLLVIVIIRWIWVKWKRKKKKK